MADTDDSVFEAYAAYYDLLYRDKDYAGESRYVHQLIEGHTAAARDILELGCGTGRHAEEFARLGYRVHGIDLSSMMLREANARRERLPNDIAGRLSYGEGDVRDWRTPVTFDAVVALFHVLSYQTSNEDLERTLHTAAVHLKPGGLLIADFWYGPAVLTQKPEVRVRELCDDRFRVLRIAEPRLITEENRVNVVYRLLVEDMRAGGIRRMDEVHPMRYLFKPELELLLREAGFAPQLFAEWMTLNPVNNAGWSSVVVARRAG